MRLDELITSLIGANPPIRITAYDGTDMGPTDAATHIDIKSRDAVQRIIAARGQEIGFSRAIVAGEIEVHGDIFGLFDVNHLLASPSLDLQLLKGAGKLVGVESLSDLRDLKRLAPPPEEIALKGRMHSRSRDAEAISSHYDVSNDFYDLVLGPAMTYSCAVFEDETNELATAQANKHDLVSRKLNLQPGMRLLDIGCGWGSMVMHAAQHYGVDAVGVTISVEQAERARKRVSDAGLSDQVEIRIQDYRDIPDGPYDAISSIGMSEHVGGPKEIERYFTLARKLLAPNGRFLNHAISRATNFEGAGKTGFINRYVFPDGELHEIGATLTALQGAGFEARHMESFRLHYAKTLRMWVHNLESNWDNAVAEVGRGRAMVWRLYMAGSAVAFERNQIQLHQVLAVQDSADNATIPLLNDWPLRSSH